MDVINLFNRIPATYGKAARHTRLGMATALIAGATTLFATPALAQEVTPEPQEIVDLAKPSVVGGRDVWHGEWRRNFRWMVTLVPFGRRNTLACGGTLIAPDWVLTAAHCLEGTSPSDIQIRVNARRLSTPGRIVNVQQIISHPNYRSATFDSDIALIKLSSPLSGIPFVNVASIGGTNTYAGPGDRVRVLGWGAIREGGPNSDRLKIANVPIQKNRYCNSAYSGGITRNMICAAPRSGGTDGCQGDSGGPLVVKDGDDAWIQVGITSFGRGCARPGTPGVYTRVGRFRGWINQTMASRSACTVGAVNQPVRTPDSFDCVSVAANDDSGATTAEIGFPVNFGGATYTTLNVNNNGSLSFGSALPEETPSALEDQAVPMIAPFFASSDTGAAGNQSVSYGQATIDGKRAFLAIWQGDGPEDGTQDVQTTYQVALIETQRGSGNFKLEFNYDGIQGATDDASSDASELGEISARVGWAAPGPRANSRELRGSGVDGAFVDGGARALSENGNAAKTGRYAYTFTDGIGRGP